MWGTSANVNDWIFYFNYETTTCNGQYYNSQKSISGATEVAHRGESDFLLLELSKRPSSDFNAYYSGWDRRNNRPSNGSTINHPEVSRKRIALYEKKATRVSKNSENTGINVKCWEVEFSAGTIASGSSGGPFYNDAGRIVGQVKGGAPTLPDPFINECFLEYFRGHFGRFDISWDAGSSASSRLRDWLNPSYNTTSFLAMDGDEPCRTSYAFENANDLHTSDNNWGMRSYDGVYTSSGTISAGNNVIIQNGTTVEFYGNEIVLSPGFRASSGSTFIASAQPCQRVCSSRGNEEEKDIVIDSQNNDKKQTMNPNIDLGIETNLFNNNEQISISPNPNSGTFQLETNFSLSDITNLKVMDMLGVTVYETKNITSNIISLENSAAGFYFVVIILKDGTVLTQKMMKQQ